MDGDYFLFILGLLAGIILGMVILIISIPLENRTIDLDQQTADDICHNLTGNSTSVAYSEDGKLICEIPSYDSTTNIIIRPAEGGNRK